MRLDNLLENHSKPKETDIPLSVWVAPKAQQMEAIRASTVELKPIQWVSTDNDKAII